MRIHDFSVYIEYVFYQGMDASVSVWSQHVFFGVVVQE